MNLLEKSYCLALPAGLRWPAPPRSGITRLTFGTTAYVRGKLGCTVWALGDWHEHCSY